jgi:signal transduction histidine kinase
MAGALLVASMVNFAILMGERYRADINEQSGPAIARFVDFASEIKGRTLPDRARLMAMGRPGGGRFMLGSDNPIDLRGLKRDGGLEQRLHRALSDADIEFGEVRAATRVVTRPERMRGGGGFGPGGFGPGGFQGQGPGGFGGPPPGDPGTPAGFAPGGPQDSQFRPPMMAPTTGANGPLPQGSPRPMREAREIVLAAQLADGQWLNGTVMSPEPPDSDVLLLGISTFVTFAFVLGAALWVARRLSRPLQDLASAASRVGAAAAEPEEVIVRGPGDVRQTLEAFNAMSRRVSQLLGEKDVMLGALGHDLRTPLSSLRIRIESMEPESERLKAVKTIEEANQLLEDILELARQGRSSEPVKTMDISVLVEDIVEDYAETGVPVTLISSQKAPVACRPVLFRRALRNLIDNAVAYGKTARLSVLKSGNDVLVRIEDDGPGMSEEALATATRPFLRGEASRSRATGGSGLGLTLADAIAKAHGGALELTNRSPHGLAATVRLPLATPTPTQPPQA